MMEVIGAVIFVVGAFVLFGIALAKVAAKRTPPPE